MNKPAELVIPIKCAVKGSFHIEVIRNAGTPEEVREDYGNHKNKIVQQGLDFWGATTAGIQSTWQGLAVGTGNTAPSAGDTQLAVPLAFVSDSGVSGFSSAVGTAPYAMNYSKTYTFAVGAVVGNIAELGVIISSPVAANGKIFNRALIQVGGSPGTITLTAADQLVVTYLTQVGLASDQSGSITPVTDGVPGSAITWTMRPYAMGNINTHNTTGTVIGVLSDGFTGYCFLQNVSAFLVTTNTSEPANAVSATKGAYTAGSNNVNFTVNIGTGSALTFQLMGLGTSFISFQFLLASPITKLNTQTLAIVYNFSWADVS